MELILFHQLVMQGMSHLNALTHLDVVWTDTRHQKQYSFSNRDLPAVLDFDAEQEYPLILALFQSQTDEPFDQYCAAATASFLEFVFIPLYFDTEPLGMIRIGPFITGPLTEQQLSAHLVSLSLPLTQVQSLRHYYDGVPMLHADAARSLGHIGLNLFGHTSARPHACLYQSPEKTTVDKQPVETATQEDTALIEKRYAYEHDLTRAVANGNSVAIAEAMSFFGQSEGVSSLMNRFPENPLRGAKNLAIVLNTILRHAAEKGGLHPVHIHRVSSKYAVLIEHARTRTAVQQLQDDMPLAYAEAVRQYTLPNLSPYIRQIVDHILMNLDQPLSQGGLAKQFHLLPANLANQFKRETGQTVTAFIQSRRIREACHYLQHTSLPISEISRFVGLVDANYFSRLFKKELGCTPQQYRKTPESRIAKADSLP